MLNTSSYQQRAGQFVHEELPEIKYIKKKIKQNKKKTTKKNSSRLQRRMGF